MVPPERQGPARSFLTNPKEEIVMDKVKKVIGLVCLAVLFAIGLYGCGGDNSTATPLQPTATTAAVAAPTNTTAPVAAPTDTTAAASEPTATTATTSGGGGNSGDAASLLQQSSTAMKSVKSYHIVLKTSSGGTETTADGDFALPDKARLVISSTGGQTTVLIVGGDAYTQVPGSDGYYKVPGAGAGFLQGTSTTASLADVAENATVVGDETLDGVATTHVKFSYNQDKATAMAAQAAGQPIPTPSVTLGEASADAWVEKSTGYIHQFMSTSTVAGASNTTTVTFSKFNEDINPPITVPTNILQIPGAPGAGTTPTP
jgi:outer membrane lipoprotein-sorting protein